MCGRIVQYEGMAVYMEELSPQGELFSGFDALPINRFNVAPSTRVQILRGADDGLHIDAVKWGWAPFWAKGKRPDPINARVETVATGKFFKHLWPDGRALVPSDGWFEWVKDAENPKLKQPYFIRLKDRSPMFLGALAQVHPGLEPQEGDGFVIITAASDSGMVDIHDRRPLVLTPDHAREWIQPDLSVVGAEQIAKECCRPTQDFEWFKVGREVGNVKNQGPGLIEPLEAPRT
ncbi:SOS response-associated peptidase family protein [Pseudomonas sp. AB12(2023)]|uniref:SOS response-associated peptidase family protein n=1 Tax=Pseudomonas sp. AB12(2023) TaxID=3048597 RepID=UPI002B23B6D4|nr:SOS response-associated peptidase family protein [Pseudomonas sp. AB12(2023)]MEB0222182.1 SOS response-associated peptidase family protein [Pseudomonas sp. AB12(2023)]